MRGSAAQPMCVGLARGAAAASARLREFLSGSELWSDSGIYDSPGSEPQKRSNSLFVQYQNQAKDKFLFPRHDI